MTWCEERAHFKLVPYFPEISPFSPCWFAWIFSSVGQLCFVKHAVTDGVCFCLCRESRHILPYKQKRTFRAMLTPVCLTQCEHSSRRVVKIQEIKDDWMSMWFGTLKVIQGCVCYAVDFNLERDFSVFVSHLAEDMLKLLQRYIDVGKTEKRINLSKYSQVTPLKC